MSEFTLIEASNGAKPKVVGVAYSGGKMNLPGWRHPVVVDLAGMEIPESVPLLTNHENKTDSRIGIISAQFGTMHWRSPERLSPTAGMRPISSHRARQERTGS